MAHHNASLLSSDISRRNPQDEYELIQKIGSGTYGDVYKVSASTPHIIISNTIKLKVNLEQN